MDKIIYVLGNDSRYVYVKSILKEKGFSLLENISSENLPNVIILPMQGLHEDVSINEVTIDDSFFKIHKNAIFVSGTNTNYLLNKQEKFGFKQIVLNNMPQFTNVNSIATAEGVLALILKNKKKLLSELTVMILGYGKSSRAIADLLTRNKVKNIIVARSEISRVEAYTMSKYVTSFNELTDYLKTTDIIVNTVPSLVVTKEIMQKCNKDIYIIDIASKPGGVDYEAANNLGLNAYLAPGLPSIYAPYSSALALVNTLIKELGM